MATDCNPTGGTGASRDARAIDGAGGGVIGIYQIQSAAVKYAIMAVIAFIPTSCSLLVGYKAGVTTDIKELREEIETYATRADARLNSLEIWQEGVRSSRFTAGDAVEMLSKISDWQDDLEARFAAGQSQILDRLNVMAIEAATTKGDITSQIAALRATVNERADKGGA